jgi:uncharacterized membrane protein
MADYEQTQQVDAPAEEVFAWLADVSHLPDYLPPVLESSIEGPSEGDNPGQKLRTKLQRPGDDQGTFTAEGYLAVDEAARRMEWGAESGRDYSGWLTVADADGGSSEVTVHLALGPRSAEADIPSDPSGGDPLQEGIAATLESIRRQIEEGSGKLPPPSAPEGAENSLEDNPAVVDEQPSTTS